MDFSQLNPRGGWFDLFNGIRTPEDGSAASFEDLLSMVIDMKTGHGIRVKNLALEETELKARMCRIHHGLCRKKGGPESSPPNCCG